MLGHVSPISLPSLAPVTTFAQSQQDDSQVSLLGPSTVHSEHESRALLCKCLASSEVRQVVAQRAVKFGKRVGGGYCSDVYRVKMKPFAANGQKCQGQRSRLMLKLVDTHRCPKVSNYDNELAICKLIQANPHSHLVRIVDIVNFSRPFDHFWLIMPHEGHELSRFMGKVRRPAGRLPEHVARHAWCQLVCAMHHLHSLNVVHRDVKPENVLVRAPSGDLLSLHAKLIDFGFSKLVSPRKRPCEPALCMSHKGTLEFMAPELLINSLFYDAIACDVYSLGVLLYFMLHGSGPWQTCGSPKGLASLLHTYHTAKLESIYFPELSRCDALGTSGRRISIKAQSLIRSILQADPKKRPTLSQIVRHSWMRSSQCSL